MFDTEKIYSHSGTQYSQQRLLGINSGDTDKSDNGTRQNSGNAAWLIQYAAGGEEEIALITKEIQGTQDLVTL